MSPELSALLSRMDERLNALALAEESAVAAVYALQCAREDLQADLSRLRQRLSREPIPLAGVSRRRELEAVARATLPGGATLLSPRFLRPGLAARTDGDD